MSANEYDPGAKFEERVSHETVDAAPAEDVDPASYRDLTKEEVLDRIAKGYKAFLDGDHRPIHELLEELDAMDD